MSWFEFTEKLEPDLRNGNLTACIECTISKLKSSIDCPFQIASDLEFTNDPIEIANHFDNFIAAQSGKFDLKAIYTETNGFDINPNRWFFDVFAYDEYSGHEDYNWLSDWRSESYPDMTLTGMEKLQEVYASNAFQNKDFSEAVDYASLLVVLKFQNLIKLSAPMIKKLNVPLLATSHDYDFIYEYKP
jgi:hypothetical protein